MHRLDGLRQQFRDLTIRRRWRGREVAQFNRRSLFLAEYVRGFERHHQTRGSEYEEKREVEKSEIRVNAPNPKSHALSIIVRNRWFAYFSFTNPFRRTS